MNRWTTATVRCADFLLAIGMLMCFTYQVKHNPPDSFPVLMSGFLWIYFTVVTIKNFLDHAREIREANPNPVMKYEYFVAYNFTNGSGRIAMFRDEPVKTLRDVEKMEEAIAGLGRAPAPIVITNFILLGYAPYVEVASS